MTRWMPSWPSLEGVPVYGALLPLCLLPCPLPPSSHTHTPSMGTHKPAEEMEPAITGLQELTPL